MRCALSAGNTYRQNAWIVLAICIEIKETPIGDENGVLPDIPSVRTDIEIKETPIGDENTDYCTTRNPNNQLKLKRPR